MFKLLQGNLKEPTQIRRQIATELLSLPDSKLEHNTMKVKHLCQAELRHVSKSGTMPQGSLLHAILSITALHLELDSGELESLNSMIKSSMALANNSNMSLELLSARVNSRKSMTLASLGQTKLASLKPLASALARASVLYQGFEQDALEDVDRWAPAAPVACESHKPASCDPSLG